MLCQFVYRLDMGRNTASAHELESLRYGITDLAITDLVEVVFPM
jgi:hypothetical protein